jgi:EAL domain-containing protein (putative c-di-GMP-specific phosphodiesterase class I)/ActR/RegA family two-component response regulator
MSSPVEYSNQLLVVDDDPVQCLLIRRAAETAGWIVHAAGTYDEAEHSLRARQYRAIILDLSLGENEGVSLLSRINKVQDDPIVIFISGLDNRLLAACRRLASALGMRSGEALRKPFTPRAIQSALGAIPSRPARHSADPVIITPRDLEEALARDEIKVEFQPKVDLNTDKVVGVEALARWTREGQPGPRTGEVPPEIFVPIAERHGLIDRLTGKIIREAVTACASWYDLHPDCGVAINVSPLMLSQPRLPEEFEKALRFSGLPAGAVTVEITESTVLANPALAAEVVTRLRIKGLRASIDDFGTGHSSLLTLLRLPFTELKIDKSFVGICDADMEAWTIVRATISMARELGLSVVAEGIELPHMAEALRGAGCAIGQGWYFGRAMSAKSLEGWLRRKAAARTLVNEPA